MGDVERADQRSGERSGKGGLLGRGLRVPANMTEQPKLMINSHKAWTEPIRRLLDEVLEVEDRLTWGYDERRASFAFPIFNLRYEVVQVGSEVKTQAASDPRVTFIPQSKERTVVSTFRYEGTLTASIAERDWLSIDDAVKVLRVFLKQKDQKVAARWTKSKLRDWIVKGLLRDGQDATFVSRDNFLRLQKSLGVLFRPTGTENPRLGQVAESLVAVDLTSSPRQSFSEALLKEHGTLYTVDGDDLPFGGHEKVLWDRYQKLHSAWTMLGSDAGPEAEAIGPRLKVISSEKFRVPWNAHFVTHEPERKFSDLLFVHDDLFDSIAKMPNRGGYAFPYSYKPAGTGKSHVTHDQFNPDFFLKVAGTTNVVVVEIKSDADDGPRNRAKCRDGLQHFEELNAALEKARQKWRYTFLFLSPENYDHFFDAVRDGRYPLFVRFKLV